MYKPIIGLTNIQEALRLSRYEKKVRNTNSTEQKIRLVIEVAIFREVAADIPRTVIIAR